MLFSTATLTFLRGLKRHNERVWFEGHRAEYEAVVQQPMRQLIEELDVRLARLAPEIIGDPKRSMFRIYRDIRFSADKSPYKTHAACWLYHRDGSRAVGREATGGGAGFYFQIAPGDSFLGGGMWMPPREALLTLRESIAEDLKRFTRIATDRRLLRRFGGLFEEAVLRRVPRGFAPDHPAARGAAFRLRLPLVRWITGGLGLRAAERRWAGASRWRMAPRWYAVCATAPSATPSASSSQRACISTATTSRSYSSRSRVRSAAHAASSTTDTVQL